MNDQVNEQTTAYLSITFRDKAGAVQAPVSVSYRIDDVGSGHSIREETEVAPNGTVEIVLTPSDNSMVNVLLPREQRRVTVVARYGNDDGIRSHFVYLVNNLPGVPNV